jgi:endoglucanase
MHQSLLLSPLLLLLVFSCGEQDPGFPPFSGEVSDDINLNQVGIYPDDQLRFSVITFSAIRDTLAPATAPPELSTYYLTNPAGDLLLVEGQLGELRDWKTVGGVTAHYTELPAPPVGTYRIYVPEVGYSHEFRVGEGVFHDAFVASMKSNYYQRAGQTLEPEHAGVYARPAGHPDTEVYFHPSSGRSGTTSSPGGWYDAGDFNKYIVNAAFPLGQYLSLYEDIGDPLPDGSLNIPESGNGTSDFLDELRYELDWMLTMQDDDGGLFHKLTTLDFEGMVMPHEATNQRYIVGKGTAATLDFAGAAAQAARVFQAVDPVYADQLLNAAQRAWAWAAENNNIAFQNPADVSTGQYGDRDFSSEQTFATAELFVSTGEEKFLIELQEHPPRIRYRSGESWTAFMGQLGVFSLLRHEGMLPEPMRADLSIQVLEVADSLVSVIDTSAYHQPVNRFVWGSTSDVLNAAMVLCAAYDQEPKPAYLAGIRSSVDYIFGHNPLGISYVTGYGDKTPMFIHHRASVADGIAAPIPGFLSGGANMGQQDKPSTTYPHYAAPMQSWADQVPSYASNEICLNWNAPLTYVLGWLEARQ